MITVHGSFNPYVCGITEEDYADWLHLKTEKMLENYLFVMEQINRKYFDEII